MRRPSSVGAGRDALLCQNALNECCLDSLLTLRSVDKAAFRVVGAMKLGVGG